MEDGIVGGGDVVKRNRNLYFESTLWEITSFDHPNSQEF